jgi:hypothetical protein
VNSNNPIVERYEYTQHAVEFSPIQLWGGGEGGSLMLNRDLCLGGEMQGLYSTQFAYLHKKLCTSKKEDNRWPNKMSIVSSTVIMIPPHVRKFLTKYYAVVAETSSL